MDQKKASKIFWDIYTAYPEYEDKGKRTEKKDMGSIRNEKQAIEALKKLMYKTEDDIKERNIPEYQHKFNNWLRGLIKEFEEGKIKWMG